MRFYNIVITDPASGKQVRQYTSFVNGKNDPGALNVTLDIPVYPLATPAGDAAVQIWGIGLQEIGQASDLNGMLISVFGGFKAGLPLANPAQSGLLVKGYVFQAFGNWIGVDQTLDLVIKAGTPPTATALPSSSTARNIALDWKAGTPLATALRTTLSTAYPGYTLNIDISDKVVRPNDQPGIYSDTIPFAQFIKQASQSIVGGNYAGVDIVLTDKTISVYDGVGSGAASAPTQIAFQDLIGQVTWVGPAQINFKCAMRADLQVGKQVKMPATVVTNTAQAQSSLINQKATFQGGFYITDQRHVGNFRQPDAASWITSIDAAALNLVSAV